MRRLVPIAASVAAAGLSLGSFAVVAAEPGIALTGLVDHPLTLTLTDLRGFPSVHVAATQVSGKGPVRLDCSGAAVNALLDKAGLNLGKANNARLAHGLLVTADDGYAVMVSLGEIDPDYGNEQAIIATDCGGQALDAPRLVMPADKHGGRAVRGVAKIEVK
ncbi:MAG TPA: hypothetical protein VG798_00945 [Rhizomicrobium sp.]|nr:hypothetical protein [Rhizomicrobium sp.]